MSTVTQSVPAVDTEAEIGGLCVGVPYTFTLQAVNKSGTGSASPASDPVVPLVAQAPSVPLITSVYPKSHELVVEWEPPSIDGGDALNAYSLSVQTDDSTKTMTFPDGASSAVVTGLVNGTTYSISLVATSNAGSSGATTASGTPEAKVTPYAPQSFQALPNGRGGIVVSWSAPSFAGTSPVDGYDLTYQRAAFNGNAWRAAGSPRTLKLGPAAASRTLVLVKGFYAISVVAVSASGAGPPAMTSNPVSPTIDKSKETVILSPGSMKSLVLDDAGVLVWKAPVPNQVSHLAVGQILVGAVSSAAPQGLLATVDHISHTSKEVTITTGTAILSEAFSNLSFSTTGNPLAVSGAQFKPASAGIRELSAGPHSSVSLSLSKSFAINLSDGPVRVSGSASLSANLSLSAEINTGWLDIPDGLSITSSATVSASTSLQAGIGGSAQWQLGTITLPPITIPVGPVPVVIEPKVPVYLNLDGSITVGVSAKVTIGASISWTSKDPGHLTTKNLSSSPSIDGGPLAGVSATASADISLSIQPQLDIYGVAGPNLQATASLTATVNFDANPYFTLVPQISLAAGLDFDIWVFHASLEVNLGTHTFSGISLSTPPKATISVSPANSTVSPGNPLQFSSSRSDGQVVPVTWSLHGATSSDQISSGGLLSVGYPVNRSFTVVAEDSSGSIGETSVTVVAPPETPPGQPTNVQAQNPGQTSVTISWNAPIDQGGSVIIQYSVSGPGSGCTTSGTSCVISGLSSGSSYTACVQAENSFGWGSGQCVGFTTESSTQSPPSPTVSIQKGNVYSGNEYWTEMTVSNFPTGSGSFVCHWTDGSTSGPYDVSVPSANYTWAPSGTGTGVGCFAYGLSVWISIDAHNGVTYDSNTVAL